MTTLEYSKMTFIFVLILLSLALLTNTRLYSKCKPPVDEQCVECTDEGTKTLPKKQ